MKDAFLQGRASNDAIINNYQVVDTRLDTAIRHVIHMRCQVVTRISLSNERTQLNILPGHLFRAHIIMKDILQFLMCRDASQSLNPFDFLLVYIVFETTQQTIERHFRCVWNEREHCMRNVIIDGLQHLRCQLFAQLLALVVNVLIGTS